MTNEEFEQYQNVLKDKKLEEYSDRTENNHDDELEDEEEYFMPEHEIEILENLQKLNRKNGFRNFLLVLIVLELAFWIVGFFIVKGQATEWLENARTTLLEFLSYISLGL